jgi:hypothetical protein
MIVRVNCQHCGHLFEVEAIEKTVFCPSCNRETLIAGNARAESKSATAFNTDALNKRIKYIRREAAIFIVLAVISFLFGVLIVVSAFFGAFGSDGLAWLIAGCGFISIAVWLYLIAQIVFIRANTER